MELKKHIKLLVCSAFFCGAATAAYSLYASVKNPTHVSVHCDTCLSEQTKTSIAQSVEESLKSRNNAGAVLKKLQTEVPSINKVIINRRNSGGTHVTVSSEAPWILVKHLPTNHLILSANGAYSPQGQYEQSTLAGLPHVIVTSKEFTPQHQTVLHTWLKKLPQNFFDRYSVTWHKPTHLTIQDSQQPRLVIVADIKTVFDSQLQNNLKKIYAQAVASAGRRIRSAWEADVRFDGQIVLSSKNRSINKKGRI